MTRNCFRPMLEEIEIRYTPATLSDPLAATATGTTPAQVSQPQPGAVAATVSLLFAPSLAAINAGIFVNTGPPAPIATALLSLAFVGPIGSVTQGATGTVSDLNGVYPAAPLVVGGPSTDAGGLDQASQLAVLTSPDGSLTGPISSTATVSVSAQTSAAATATTTSAA